MKDKIRDMANKWREENDANKPTVTAEHIAEIVSIINARVKDNIINPSIFIYSKLSLYYSKPKNYSHSITCSSVHAIIPFC